MLVGEPHTEFEAKCFYYESFKKINNVKIVQFNVYCTMAVDLNIAWSRQRNFSQKTRV